MTWRSALAVIVLTGSVACAGARTGGIAPAECQPGDTSLVRTELLMGRNIPGGGEVSDDDWRAFMADFVTPRFPNGLTVLEGSGQWRGANGVIERERGKILMVLTGDTAASRAADEIMAEYKRRFRQESVLRVRSRACVRFDS